MYWTFSKRNEIYILWVTYPCSMKHSIWRSKSHQKSTEITIESILRETTGFGRLLRNHFKLRDTVCLQKNTISSFEWKSGKPGKNMERARMCVFARLNKYIRVLFSVHFRDKSPDSVKLQKCSRFRCSRWWISAFIQGWNIFAHLLQSFDIRR